MRFTELQSPLLRKIPNLSHGFLSNHNESFAALLNEKEPSVCTMKQVHGTEIIFLEKLEKRTKEADALATATPSLPVGVHSADCAPILLASIKNHRAQAVAAIHAGWRGTAAKIAQSSFEQFFRSFPGDRYIALIGPCIQFAQFEVGEEVVAAFPNSLEPGLAKFLRNDGDKKKFLFDLPGENARQLLEAAAANKIKLDLEILPYCTFLEKETLPSFRRDREKAGRILSWISFGQ
jgi:YfiH family protein